MYSGYSGLILVAYLLYLFLSRIELFLIISFMLESFSIISQSLTLSNRLSINILAGSLLISSLSVAVIIFSIYLIINSLFTGIDYDSLLRATGFFRFILLAFAISYYLSIDNGKYEKIILKFWTIIFLTISIDLVFEYICNLHNRKKSFFLLNR